MVADVSTEIPVEDKDSGACEDVCIVTSKAGDICGS